MECAMEHCHNRWISRKSGVSFHRFLEIYRLPPSMAMQLITELEPFLAIIRNSRGLPNHLQVLAALNLYASGSYQRRVGLDAYCSISQTTVSRCIRNVSYLIAHHLGNKYVTFPYDTQEVVMAKNVMFEATQVPNLIGLVDEYESCYVNRKGFHSINVQVICNSALTILNVNARYPGSTHDSYIWNTSLALTDLSRIYERDGTTMLFGDSGCPLQPWLMTPYRNPRTEAEISFHQTHSRVRNAVERCLGVLKRRFRCLHKERKLKYSHIACCTLHNFIISKNYPVEANIEILYDDDINENSGVIVDRQLNLRGEQNRTALANFILNEL